MEESKHVYHEKQRMQFCLLHSLNNLLQAQVLQDMLSSEEVRHWLFAQHINNYVSLTMMENDSFTRAELDAIAEKLVLDDPVKDKWTPLSLIFKPHHNILTGNYDVNVLIAALEARGKGVIWHDRRHDASSIKLSEENLLGIVLNIPVRKFGFWKGRHWITLRKIAGVWYNLDSDLTAPKPFCHKEEVTKFLNNFIGQNGEVLIVSHV